jgi:hypothetical protein
MGQEDARRGSVYWLLEPFDGKHIPRLVKSTHHQGAEALAKTHRLSLAALGQKMRLQSSQMTHPPARYDEKCMCPTLVWVSSFCALRHSIFSRTSGLK